MDAKTRESVRALAITLQRFAWPLGRLGVSGVGLSQLPQSQLAVMTYIEHHPGVSVKEVAEGLFMKGPNVSATVSGLVERGLVRREADTDNARRTRLYPTERCIADTEKIMDVLTDIFVDALDQLTPEDTKAVIRAVPALTQLEEHLRALGE